VTNGGPPRKPSDPRLSLSRAALSERPVPDSEGERIWKQVKQIDKGLRDDFATFEGKMLGYVADIATDVTGLKDRVAAVEKSTTSNVVATQAVEQLSRTVGELKASNDQLSALVVRQLERDAARAGRDLEDEKRLAAVEQEQKLMAQQAGGKAGRRWGALAGVLGPAILWAVQQLTGIGLPTKPIQSPPAPLTTTPLPP
jgi:hypothetical protein